MPVLLGLVDVPGDEGVERSLERGLGEVGQLGQFVHGPERGGLRPFRATRVAALGRWAN